MQYRAYPNKAVIADMRAYAAEPIIPELSEIAASWANEYPATRKTEKALSVAVAFVIMAAIAIILIG